MRLKTMSVGEMQANGYVAVDESSNKAVIFDPGAEPERFISFLTENGCELQSIVLTHAHFDHIGGCREIKERYNVPVIICEGEEAVISDPVVNLTASYDRGYTLEYDKVLKDGEKYKFGELEFLTVNTPGHTPGCACYLFEKQGIMISGDTLFRRSIGRTDFPLGDTGKMMESLKRLSLLEDDITVYPGHGPHTTIGEEKLHNPYMKSVI